MLFIGRDSSITHKGMRFPSRHFFMKRMAQAEEIAKTILFLASTDSSYFLGAELFVDGGMSQI
jgi:NAD(P)-dependent dehydrogenase (short-subunit alcohol dehydrogenase family)